MRSLASLALVVTSAAFAQSPLVTLAGGTNQGSIGGVIYFDLQVHQTVTLNRVDCQTGAATAAGMASVQLWFNPVGYFGGTGSSGLWSLVGTTTPTAVVGGTQLFAGNIVPALPFATLTLPPGNYAFALQAIGFSHGYSNGIGCTHPAAPGTCANSIFSSAELTLRAGAAQNNFLTGGVFAHRVFNGAIHYTVGGSPTTPAQRLPYGKGCYANYRSFYEFMPSTATGQDLSNTSMLLTFDAVNNRYSNITAGTTPVNVAAITSPNLALANNASVVVALANNQPIPFPNIGGSGQALASVQVCSNGYVTLLGSNPSTPANPSPAQLLATGQPRIGNWVDLDPSGLSIAGGVAGAVHYDYDAAQAAHLFTWRNCILSGILASPNTFQMAFFANGNVEFRWGTMSLLGGTGWPTLIGFSPGQASIDPGSIDLSASFPFATSGIDRNPLTLVADVNPVLGSLVNLTTSGETGLGLGLCFVGRSDLSPFSPVGLDLGIIGAPGCVANVDVNQAVGNLISNLGLPGASMSLPMSVPVATTFIGTDVFAQSAWFDASQNPGGLITSNAMRLRIGL
jgi:hypothetical protein